MLIAGREAEEDVTAEVEEEVVTKTNQTQEVKDILPIHHGIAVQLTGSMLKVPGNAKLPRLVQ